MVEARLRYLTAVQGLLICRERGLENHIGTTYSISYIHVPLSLLYQEEECWTVRVVRVLLILKSVSVFQDFSSQILSPDSQGGPRRINEAFNSLFSTGIRFLFFLSPFLIFDKGRNFTKLIFSAHGCFCLLGL